MKRKLLALAALVALAACALGGAALAEPTPPPKDTMQTEVAIQFQQLVVFVTVDGKSMDINFGEQKLPTGDTYIPAVDRDHTLYIGDRRTTAGTWSVNAQISPFASAADGNFIGTLQLHSPTFGSTTGMAPPTPNLTDGEGGEHIAIGPIAARVAQANKPAAITDYSLTFTKEDTRVVISTAEAVKVRPTAYTATVTWTLDLTPP